MRILHIINSLSTGGAEKLIMETVPRYNALGLKVDVLLLNGVPTPFLDNLQKMQCCKVMILGVSSPYRFKFIRQIIPQFKKYDLIHVHLFPANYLSALAKLISRSRTPLVLTEHSTSNRRFRNPLFRLINAIIYRLFTKIVCITGDVNKIVRTNTLLPENRLTVIQNGVAISTYVNAPVLKRTNVHRDLCDEDFLLIQVASLRQPKDQGTAIRALAHLPNHVKLLLAGEGPLLREYEELTKHLRLEERVFFLGVRSDIPNLLRTCNVTVLSSNYEGLSLASIEAMASGQPLVASDVPGLSEVVGGAGILFPKGDDKTLASEIIRLMKDEIYYGEVANRCTERSKDYDIDIMVTQHIKLYKSLVKPKHADL